MTLPPDCPRCGRELYGNNGTPTGCAGGCSLFLIKADLFGDEPSGDVHTPSETSATAQPLPAEPPAIARDRAILDRFKEEIRGCGLVGEERNAAIVYLALTSRLLERQVSVAVKGHSASGKSWLVETTASFFPADELIVFTAMSERALVYSERTFQHKTLIIFEAVVLREGIEDNLTAYFVRSLLSEGRIEYEVTVREDDHFTTKVITRKARPTSVLTTTQVRVHAENETRLLSLDTDDSPDQTQRVMLELAADDDREARSLEDWHQLQHWLQDAEHRVVVPFGRRLAELMQPVAVRLRRDFSIVLALIRAHAMLHQLSRARDEQGRVVAEVEDYVAVRDVVAVPLGAGLEPTVTDAVRETVAAVADLADENGVMAKAVATQLEVDKSNASRRLRAAAAPGYIRNLEEKRGKPGRWVIADPLPEDRDVLPQPHNLEEPQTRMNKGGCAVAADSEGHVSPPAEETLGAAWKRVESERAEGGAE